MILQILGSLIAIFAAMSGIWLVHASFGRDKLAQSQKPDYAVIDNLQRWCDAARDGSNPDEIVVYPRTCVTEYSDSPYDLRFYVEESARPIQIGKTPRFRPGQGFKDLVS